MEEYTKRLMERLKWFIYDCTYAEYDQQEVDYTINVLRGMRGDNEAQIEASCLAISVNPNT